MKKQLAILRDDPWLGPYAPAIEGRHQDVLNKLEELTGATDGSLASFANAYNYFGLHRDRNGNWIFREYAPNATKILLTGTFTGWKDDSRYNLNRLEDGTW